MFQIGTFGALSAGRYDGIEPIGLLGKHGDFGVGTFDRLDCEMIGSMAESTTAMPSEMLIRCLRIR